jgi:hypothetical protein
MHLKRKSLVTKISSQETWPGTDHGEFLQKLNV